MDDVTWGALVVALTVLGGLLTWGAFRRRSVVSGLRWLALTLLPAAAWLTGTLEMFTEIVGSVADWATSLVFSPTVWMGTGLAGTSVLLLLVAKGLDRWRPRETGRPRRVSADAETPAVGRGTRPGTAPGPADDEFGDIEELLRRRGIE